MSHDALINSVEEWLVDQALGSPSIVKMYEEVCERLFLIGIPVTRSIVSWPTLHPLIEVETVIWRQGQSVVMEQHHHREEETEEWLRSPLKHLLDSNLDLMRRRLTGPQAMVDFPLLEDLRQEGYTDYLAMATEFQIPRADDEMPSGIIISWSSDRSDGFSDADIAALQRIQRSFAVACRTVIQARIAANITETYLGKYAGGEVLAGQIRRGDGVTTKAVILYSDLRDSTALAETMDGDDYLSLLNDYYECSASAAIDAGGEVLDFIGDAVLSIFPLSGSFTFETAIKAASTAVSDAIARKKELNRRRRADGQTEIRFGMSCSVGHVMFGNIGVPTRLTFSVIGPAVNAAARIEKMTKGMIADALATEPIASICPDNWRTIGHHSLDGLSRPTELFTWHDGRQLTDADVA